MPISPGTKLGPYEVTMPIGAGGIGEVYRARDTKLDRDVAIKVLLEEFAQDKERLARFEREAKLLASLNHSNIASIYGFESGALVLELVEGPTLADKIAKGPIPVDEAVAIARQIAEALEAGHEAGVIHRDLKPANIKLKEDGTVKVLDYGLAKALEIDTPGGTDSELSQSPTLTRHGTQMGVILGSAAYMSPEQAKGKRVDRRTDIWAFGAVLYEMVTGKRAFAGDDVSDTLAAVLRAEPDLDRLPSDIPEALRRVLQLCLTKNIKERIQAVGDVRLAMKGAFETSGPPAMGSRRSMAMAAAAALLLSIVTGIAVSRLSRPVETPRPVSRSSIPFPRGVTLTRTGSHALALSPDGSRLVYNANEQLYLRVMDQTEATPLRGTEGARSPFFSPDSEWVGFWSEGQLQKVSIRGGAPVRLCVASDLFGARWGADDTIVFGQHGAGILKVSANGGTPEILVQLAESGEVGDGAQVLPGGKAVLFTLGAAANWNEARIVVQSLETGERKVLVEGGFDARYLATEHLVYVLEGTLFAVPFDVDELVVAGGAIPVAESIKFHNTSKGAAQFTVSDTGSLVYLPASVEERRTLVWVDRNGREEAIAAEPRAYKFPRISPDGSRVALDVNDQENDIWIWDFARETMTRLTFWPGSDVAPVWTPDGTRVAFMSNREGTINIFWKRADGTGTVERLTESETEQFPQFPQAFTPNGSQLVFSENDVASTDLRLLSLNGSTEPLVATEFDEHLAKISPDGRWLAYESNASGRFEIYVRPFPNVEEGRWMISRDGGTKSLWAPNGRELFYMAPGSRLMSVRVETEQGFTPGSATELFSGYFARLPGQTYDISPDGERFLMIKEGAGGEANELILVQNWFEELKRLVPTDN